LINIHISGSQSAPVTFGLWRLFPPKKKEEESGRQ
jgi:hypothetical protein